MKKLEVGDRIKLPGGEVEVVATTTFRNRPPWEVVEPDERPKCEWCGGPAIYLPSDLTLCKGCAEMYTS